MALFGNGLGGLFALRTAAVSPAYRAVVAYNVRCDLTATSVSWLTSSAADISTIIRQAGDTRAAYEMVHQFEPESFVEKLKVPALLVSSAWYGYETTPNEATQVRSSFDKHHKAYEWRHIEYRKPSPPNLVAFQVELYSGIADYLDKTMK